jgi:hypothetical protein
MVGMGAMVGMPENALGVFELLCCIAAGVHPQRISSVASVR